MKTRIAVLILAALVALTQTVHIWAQATNPPYLGQMPTVDRVKAGIKGADAIDTAARQAGAFWQLRDVIYKMAVSQHRSDRQLTPDEKRLADAYYAAYYEVWQPLEKSLAGDRPRLFKLQGYTADPDFLSEVLERLCSPAFRDEYFRAAGLVDRRVQARREAARAEQAQAAPSRAQSSAAESAAGAQPCRVTEATRAVKPGVRANSTLRLVGQPYVYTYQEANRATGEVRNSFTERGTLRDATLYLLDDDADSVLQSAGVEPGMFGSRLMMFTFLDAGTQLGNVPLLSGMSSLLGQPGAVDDIVGSSKADFDCAMKAISAHSAAQMTTDANGSGVFPAVAAGTYYLFGRFYRVTKPVRGGGVVWNMRVTLKPGQNVLRLSVEDAALK